MLKSEQYVVGRGGGGGGGGGGGERRVIKVSVQTFG
jgi:hypothetical protein